MSMQNIKVRYPEKTIHFINNLTRKGYKNVLKGKLRTVIGREVEIR
jgi:hypothetical protein